MKQVLQWRSMRGWERLTEHQIRDLVENIYPGQGFKNKLSLVVNAAILFGPKEGIRIEFGPYNRTWDHKQEQRFFQHIEMEENVA